MSVKQVFNTSAELDYPTVLPTLDLDFANTKTLDPRITFTRASGGTYVGADGLIKYAGVNEARFDHDPATGESLGLLIEEARTNLVTNNNTYTLAASSNITIDNSITSPDGTTGVQKVQSNITTGTFYSASNNLVNSSGSAQNYTWSVFVKRGNPLTPVITIQFGVTNTAVLAYNINTDTITNFTAVSFGRTIYPNGWVRLYGMTSIPNGSTFNLIVIVGSVENAGGRNAYFYQWGAQVERGSFPTSYIPTQGSTRTRAVDNAQITGRNFSSWYRQDEGTLIAKARSYNLTASTFPYIAAIDDTTNNNRTGLGYVVASLGGVFIMTNNVGQVEIYPLVNTNPRTGSLAYKLNDTATCYNGGTVFTDTSVSIPTLNRIQIGDLGIALSTIYNLNGPISRLTYYPKRLPNQQLQALTS